MSDIPPERSNVLQAAEKAFGEVLMRAPLSRGFADANAPLLREALAAGVHAALAAHGGNLPHLLGEVQAAQQRADALSDSLEEMVAQFAFYSDGGLRHSGGLPALEGAFAALGLSDPHPCEDGEPCDETDCARRAVVGFPSNEHGYRRTCVDHAPASAFGSLDLLLPDAAARPVVG